MITWIVNLIPAPYRLLAFFILMGAVFAAGSSAAWKIQDWRYGEQIADHALDDGLARAIARANASKKEREHDRLARHAEKTRQLAAAQSRALARDNRRLSDELGGLRDPGVRPGGLCGNADAAAIPADSAGTSAGLLSDRASRFLLDFAEDCDAANDYAWAAHEWAKGLARDREDEGQGDADEKARP